MKPLTLKEREYRESLLRVERRAIIPIKWIVLVSTVLIWVGLIDSRPVRGLIWLFSAYFAFNLFHSIFFYSGRVGLDRVKPLTLLSFLVDFVYVAMLIYFDNTTTAFGEEPHTNFYILLFLLVMRGFALFSTILETIIINTLISLLFILTLRLQQANFSFMKDPEFVIQIALIWVVILMAWFIMVVLNQQKIDLIQTNERLMRSSYLASIGELAAGVAHEINNPLGVIISTTEYMKKTIGDDSQMAEDIEAIHRESNRCKDIVNRMLTYANPKPGELSLVDPAALNDEVLQFVFPRGRSKPIEIVLEYEPDLAPIRADPNMLKQALLNLYLNARQAIPEDRRGKIVSRIFTRRFPATLSFEVEDNGVGIALEDMEHVFEPFFTRKSEGTGLGLSVTQKIIESMGGTISLESEQPGGAVFRIDFPLEGA